MAERTSPTLPAGATRTAPTWRAAYSDRTAALMAAFSAFAYLPFEDEPPPQPNGRRPERPGGAQALGEHLGPDFTHVQLFNRGDAQGYLAVSADFAVLAFRGTAGRKDWLTNLDADLAPLQGAPVSVRVHHGFLRAFESCRQEITQAVDARVPAGLGLYITGHSLGGALAQIASAALERDNLAACYTYGSPRVGTLDFDREVKCPHYRLINRNDLVPGVPPPWFRGFRHTGDPRLLKKGNVLLRRDRNPIARFLVDAWALLVALPRGRLFILDDHMISHYRAALEAIAGPRGSRRTTQPGARPAVLPYPQPARPPTVR
jgi:hypothetical protein